MAAQQKKTFTDGINSDNVDELLPNGQSRYRLNVRALSSNSSTIGAIETVNGNTLVVNSYLAATGVNTVIGSKEDLIRKRVYYFVHNSTGLHAIFEYNIDSNTIEVVLQEGSPAVATEVEGLNFSTSHLINSINFVEIDEDNHLMYWTDGYNEPRKLNIEKAKYFSIGNNTLGYQTPFDITWIARIKTPPPAPSYAWSNDASDLVNNLLNKNYQFKAQYIYDDNDTSAYSPFSVYAYPDVTYVENNCDNNYTQDNRITITFDSGSSIVKKIRIAAKETNNTDFFLVAELSKEQNNYSDNTFYTITFTNDSSYIPIEINESIKLFDNVPQLSKTHDIISGNRIVDGNVTEGYDAVEISMQMELDFQAVDNSTQVYPIPITDASYLKSGGTYTYGIVYYDKYNRSGTTNITDGLYNELQSNTNFGTRIKIPFLTDPAYTPQNLNSAPLVRWDIYNEAPSWATHYQIVRSKNQAMRKYYQFVAQAVAYYDDSVIPAVIANPNFTPATKCSIRIENIIGRYKEEYPASKLVYDFTPGDRIRVIANPPYFVSAYPFAPPAPGGVYGFNPTPLSSTYGALPDAVTLPYNEYEISSFNTSTQVINFRLQTGAAIPGAEVFLPGCLYEIYTPEKTVDAASQIMYEIGEEFEIIESNGRYLHQGRTGNQNIINSTSGTYSFGFQLTLAVPTGHGLIIGDKVKVIETATNDYGYGIVIASAANSVDIDSYVPWTGGAIVGASVIYKSAFGDFTSGDSFRPYQNMPYVLTLTSPTGFPDGAAGNTVYRWYSHVENMDVNNFFYSEQWDYARPNKVDPDYGRINRKTTCVFSEKFIPETNINGLSSVFDTSFETYQDKFGSIQKLYSENQNLIMFQELKIGQIPVEQTIYNDLQGGTTVGASTTILNPQALYYAGEFGIGKNPESFAVYGQAKYGIDVRRGVAWRLSADGITPISDTGFMHNYFSSKCSNMLRSTSIIPVFGGFDVKFNEYIVAFNGYTYWDGFQNIIVGAETLAWNEQANRWGTFYSYNPETISSNGVNVLTFDLGELYTHNTNAIQGQFYGVQTPAETHEVLNFEPSKVKVFEALSEETNAVWEVYSITTPNGQASNLVVADFEEKENNQYAPIWRDTNTPNLVAGTALFEGDVMRDRTFLCKFKYTPTTYNKLYAINYYIIPSERSNK